jgi:nucleoside-diphosphate-sugar epimerase
VARRLDELGAKLSLAVRDRTSAEDLIATLTTRPEVIEVDLLASGAIESLLRTTQPQVTFNLIGYGVDPEERAEDLSEQTNAHLPYRLCEQISRLLKDEWPGQQLIHVGSALEYGVCEGDLAEDSLAIPTTTYGETKLRGTESVLRWRQEEGLQAITARLFTVYGMGEHPNRLLPSLIDAARRTGPLELTSGTQKRDFTYVGDVADGLMRLGVSTGGDLGVVNLATGQLTEVRDFVLIAAEVLGIPRARLQFGALPTRPEEMQHLPVSLERLRQTLSWVPSTGIRAGVDYTLHWLRRLDKL